MSDECCPSNLDFGALRAREHRVLVVVLAINAATFLLMVVAGLASRSSALLSGALDNLGDALTYALSLAVVGASGSMKARVAFFKGIMILGAAVAIGLQIAWRAVNPAVPVFEAMGVASFVNLTANLACLYLLMPYKDGDLNMSSAWLCSRNDVGEGVAVIAAAVAVWAFDSGWPDLAIATGLLMLIVGSATSVLRDAWAGMRQATRPS